jgi:hypothetical protein
MSYLVFEFFLAGCTNVYALIGGIPTEEVGGLSVD